MLYFSIKRRGRMKEEKEHFLVCRKFEGFMDREVSPLQRADPSLQNSQNHNHNPAQVRAPRWGRPNVLAVVNNLRVTQYKQSFFGYVEQDGMQVFESTASRRHEFFYWAFIELLFDCWGWIFYCFVSCPGCGYNRDSYIILLKTNKIKIILEPCK